MESDHFEDQYLPILSGRRLIWDLFHVGDEKVF